MTEDQIDPGTIRWSVGQRLEFIEFRLVWEGRINRSDIAARFGVSVQQASADLGMYEQLAPENMLYQRVQKTFVPAPGFRPRYLRERADRQLLQLAAIAGGLVEPQDTWFEALPPIGTVPTPKRDVSTMLMRWILNAIRRRAAIEIEYQSNNRPKPTIRKIEPHALGHDGRRWHARAWCQTRREFRDFSLARIFETGALSEATIDPALDHEWNDMVELVLAPHADLEEGAKKALAREYGMERGRLRLKVRAALAFYAIRHFNLDLEGLSPERQSFQFLNRDEVETAITRAKMATRNALESTPVHQGRPS